MRRANDLFSELQRLSRTEFHILTVGNSLLAHYQDAYPYVRKPMHDHTFWSDLLDNPAAINGLYHFLSEAPSRYSAEVNSLEKYMKRYGLQPQDVTLCLLGTRTYSNEFVRAALLAFFRDMGFVIYDPPPISSFMASGHASEYEMFRRGLLELLEYLVEIGRRAIEISRRLCFNPTGGYKAHVIIMGLAAFLTGGTLYYMHEEFEDIIEFPPVFYYPSPDELEAFGRLFQSEDVLLEFDPEQMKRWIDFGLVALDLETGNGKRVRLRLTPRGKIWYQFFFKLRGGPKDEQGNSGPTSTIPEA